MSKKPYINKVDYKENKGPRGSIAKNPSQTIPGEALTISEIIERYRQGQRPDQKNFVFLDAEDLESITRYHKHPGALDYTDLEDIINSNEQKIGELRALQEKLEKEKEDVIEKNKETVDKDNDGEIDEDAPEPK